MRGHCMAVALLLAAGVAPSSLRKAFLCLGQPSPGFTPNGLGLGDSWKTAKKTKIILYQAWVYLISATQ